MLSIEEIKNALQDRRPMIVSEKTGLTIPTITGIRDGRNENPTLDTMKRLSDYLQGVSNA